MLYSATSLFMETHLIHILSGYHTYMISNSNWTEWSTIQEVIGRVISKLDKREARGQFENTSTTTP